MRRWLALGIAAAALAALAGCGGDDGGAGSSAVDEAQSLGPERTAGRADEEADAHTMADWPAVVASPDDHVGEGVQGIVGKVFVVERDGERTVVQMFTTGDLSDGNTIVAIGDPAVGRAVREGDYLRVDGTISEPFTGENAFGARITAPVVVATAAREISGPAAFIATDPPIATRRLRVAANQSGMRVTVVRVDRLANGGRVVVEAVNRTGSPASLSSSSASLVQSSRQLEPEYSDLPDFPSELQPGVRATAVLTFPGLRPGAARLVLPWYSDNFDISTEDFALPFRVP